MRRSDIAFTFLPHYTSRLDNSAQRQAASDDRTQNRKIESSAFAQHHRSDSLRLSPISCLHVPARIMDGIIWHSHDLKIFLLDIPGSIAAARVVRD